MNFITPQTRQQITYSSFEDKITAGNHVRFLEARVELLKLGKLSFVIPGLNKESRPSFVAKLILEGLTIPTAKLYKSIFYTHFKRISDIQILTN